MSGAAQGEPETTKAVVNDAKNGETMKDQQKPAATLGEDDEFEDFPVEGMTSLEHLVHLFPKESPNS